MFYYGQTVIAPNPAAVDFEVPVLSTHQPPEDFRPAHPAHAVALAVHTPPFPCQYSRAT